MTADHIQTGKEYLTRMTSIFSKLFAKLFGKKKSPYRKTVELPKTAQDTIPFMEAYDNGLFLVDEDKYTLIFGFDFQ